MKSLSLKCPIIVDGKTISELNFRYARARDMIAIADFIPAILALPEPDVDPAAAMKSMTGAVFKAMTVIVGQLSDIGEEAAGELSLDDLTDAVAEAMECLGEADGSNGKAPTGE